MIRTGRNGTEFQNIFCGEKVVSGRGKNSGIDFVNYVGYLTIGNKVIKLSVNPNMKSYNGRDGFYVTAVATNLSPRGGNSRSGNNGSKF